MDKEKKMEWFEDAKLGIFIHWGIYAVNGIDESWSFYNGYISYNDYMKQLDGFTASAYKPEEWASLIKESGAKYAVLTSKHHDGVALWDTKAGRSECDKKDSCRKGPGRSFCKRTQERRPESRVFITLCSTGRMRIIRISQKLRSDIKMIQ